jgi:hypothetical protein
VTTVISAQKATRDYTKVLEGLRVGLDLGDQNRKLMQAITGIGASQEFAMRDAMRKLQDHFAEETRRNLQGPLQEFRAAYARQLATVFDSERIREHLQSQLRSLVVETSEQARQMLLSTMREAFSQWQAPVPSIFDARALEAIEAAGEWALFELADEDEARVVVAAAAARREVVRPRISAKEARTAFWMLVLLIWAATFKPENLLDELHALALALLPLALQWVIEHDLLIVV